MAEKQSDPRKNFAPRLLPWLVTAGAFIIYAVTLNHWISLNGLQSVTKISGSWLPELTNPLLFIITYPFRWLPAGEIPIALNFFSALCAAVSLGLLARSVAILPQDRTEAQRKRERNDFLFLTIRNAWLPPLFAVIVCGLQLTFWEYATNYTGEMFDLLLFSFLVWSLLEYRLDEREGRLYLASLVYGASMTENWAMVGFFPVFLAAIIWIRGLSFFQWQFLRRMIVCGLIGMIFYFLMPAIAAVSSNVPMTFGQALKFSLLPQYNLLKNFFYVLLHPVQSAEFASLILAYLLPLFVLALRWKASFGDRSNLGAALTSFFFHIVHAGFLVLLIWMAFDATFSPRHMAGSAPFLTFYFLGALSIGYYSGYFLLIFGTKEISTRRARKRSPLRFVNPVIVTCIWLLALATTVGLICRNAPQIKSANGKTLWHYASLLTKNLPDAGGYLLSDDPLRLALAQSALAREGRAKNFVPLETQSLATPAYHRYLHKKFPAMWPDLVKPGQTNLLNPVGLVQVLAILSKTNDIYYLHPSFGYYFEEFYAQPHGLAYKMVPLPDKTLLPPKVDKNLITENENFWTNEAASALADVEKNISTPGSNMSAGEQLLEKLHIEREPDQNALVAGYYYSRSADFWGVELQRAGKLKEAAVSFETATNLNPNNVVAGINLDFNKMLRIGKSAPVDLAKTETDEFENWNAIMNADGPFDEPSFCFRDGLVLAHDNHLYRQAVAQFERVRELDPQFLPARFELAQIYLLAHLTDRALDALQAPLSNPEKFSLAQTNETELDVLAAAAYFQKGDTNRASRLLETEITRHPDNEELLKTAAQVFVMHGMFANALAIINKKLQTAPGDPAWLYSRGYVDIQMKKYNAAIADLSRVLEVQTNNYNALFNRAVANLQAGNLDASRADYEKLQQTFSNSVPVAYGLGEIAWRKHDTNAVIRNYEIYLSGANTNTEEAKTVAERLKLLKH